MTQLAQPAAQPESYLLEACADPVDLRGYQSLNAGPVERLWIIDRESLIDCRDRKAKLQGFYQDRDARLSAQQPAK